MIDRRYKPSVTYIVENVKSLQNPQRLCSNSVPQNHSPSLIFPMCEGSYAVKVLFYVPSSDNIYNYVLVTSKSVAL